MERNIDISFVSSSDKGKITGHGKFYDLLKEITSNQQFRETGVELRRLFVEDQQGYSALKARQSGFVVGNFSYRDKNSLIEYTPVLGFDIDGIQDREVFEKAFKKLRSWDYAFALFPSLSGLGIRLMVVCDCTKDSHSEFHELICQRISRLTNIPTKKAIRESLRTINKTPEEIKEYLKSNPNIDDSVSDYSRFWYYSGLDRSEIHLNEKSKVFAKRQEQAKSDSQSGYTYEFTEKDKVDYLVNKIEESRIDITQGVREWFKVGVSLIDEFGINAEDYFHRISQFHPDYKRAATQREFNREYSKHQPGRVSIATFYKWCSDYGVCIDYKELAEIHRDKIDAAKAAPQVDQPEVLIGSSDLQVKEAQQQETRLFNPEAERCVIATGLTNELLFEDIFDDYPKFSDACFVNKTSQLIFNCFQQLRLKSMKVNPVSVQAQTGLSMEVINKYTSKPFYASDVKTNAKIVYDLFLKREFVSACNESLGSISQPDIDVFDCVTSFSDHLSGIVDFGSSKTEKDAAEIMGAAIERIYSIGDKENALTGVPTGTDDENGVSGGFQDSDLIILAARPGMGKTAKSICYALEAAKAGFPVGYCSLEMSSTQLGLRMISIESGVNGEKFRKGGFEEHEYPMVQRAAEDISNLPIYIDDRGGASLNYIRNVGKRWKRLHNIRLLIIDYLQLIKGGVDTEGVTIISNGLKALAKELDIPVIALSQLNRSVETRGGTKRPMLHDLRQSGSIEQDADVVLFIYRPEYYNILQDEEGMSLTGVAEIIYAKNRHGGLVTVRQKFDKDTTAFMELENPDFSVNGFGKEMDEDVAALSYTGSISARRQSDETDVPF